MTIDQTLAFAVLVGMMTLFIWGRLRYDLVAILALLAGVLVGIVPYDKAFSGFSDDVVIIVASARIVSAAVARSGPPRASARSWQQTPRGPNRCSPIPAHSASPVRRTSFPQG